jgi:hypothetical protein
VTFLTAAVSGETATTTGEIIIVAPTVITVVLPKKVGLEGQFVVS